MIINVRKDLPAMALGTLALVISAFLCPVNHYAVAALLLICAVAAYLYIAIVQTDKNWFDIRAMFSAIWLATLGLAALRLSGYQVEWEKKTWFLMAAAYMMFHLGVDVGNVYGEKCCKWVKKWADKNSAKFHLNGERLFWICLGVTLFGLACFVLNVKIKGYIPFFSSEQDTYVSFYTKIYTFSIAATMISGLCYYTLKTQKLSVWKKVFLWISIVYATFVYPTLVVSRGAFLTAALSLTTALYYLNKKKFKVLLLCAVLIVGIYGVTTKARGYTEEQLNTFFEPVTIGGDEDSKDPDEMTDETDPEESEPGELTEENGEGFQLSGTASFIYSYLTVSHDNVNEAVRLNDKYTYGVRQLEPFNVILRIDALTEALNNCHYYYVRPHLNTVNLIGNAYYDFGFIGVVVLMFLWAFVFGFIQAYHITGDGIFSLLALGNAMSPVMLGFHAPWMSYFTMWMHWGLILLMFIATYIPVSIISKK